MIYNKIRVYAIYYFYGFKNRRTSEEDPIELKDIDFVHFEPFVALFWKYKKDVTEKERRTFVEKPYQDIKQHREIMDDIELEQTLFLIPITLGIIFN